MSTRHVESSADGGGVTVDELRAFLDAITALGIPGSARVRVKAKFGNSRGAKINEISADSAEGS